MNYILTDVKEKQINLNNNFYISFQRRTVVRFDIPRYVNTTAASD